MSTSGLPAPAVQLASAPPLTEKYDVGLLDLDGVVWHLGEPIPGAVEAVARARAQGMCIGFVTNNASREAVAVARLLSELGIPAESSDVITSAQAAAKLLAERFSPGAAVLVVGASALGQHIAEVGLNPVNSADAEPVAVVQGFGSEVAWPLLAEASLAINRGAYWVATNSDPTLPSARGPLPGNGAFIAALSTATGRVPDEVAGKPHPRLHQESIRRTQARRPLVVGDRLDTDILGAHHGGADSLLVLTGSTDVQQLLFAVDAQRPSYIADDLNGLTQEHPPCAVTATGVTCAEWTVRLEADRQFTVVGQGDRIAALRALTSAVWRCLDEYPDGDRAALNLCLLAGSEPAARVLSQYGLA